MNAPKQKTLSESLDQIEQRVNAATPGKASFTVARNDVPRLIKVVRWAIARIDTYEDGTAIGARMHIAQLLREPADSVRDGNENQPVAPVSQNPSPSSAVADDVEATQALEEKEAASDSVKASPQITLTLKTFPGAEGFWLLISDHNPHLYAKLLWVRQFDGDWRQQEKGGKWWSCRTGWWLQLPLDQLATLVLSSHSNAAGALPVNPTPSPPEHVRQMERDTASYVWKRLNWVIGMDAGQKQTAISVIREAFEEKQGGSSPATSVESPEPLCPVCGKGEEADHQHCIPFHPVSSPVSSVERDKQKDLGGKEA